MKKFATEYTEETQRLCALCGGSSNPILFRYFTLKEKQTICAIIFSRRCLPFRTDILLCLSKLLVLLPNRAESLRAKLSRLRAGKTKPRFLRRKKCLSLRRSLFPFAGGI